MIYDNWKHSYEESVRDLSVETWKKGIIAELSKIDLTSAIVLDAGAGTGIGANLIKTLGDIEVISVDRSEAMLEEARSVSDRIYVRDLADIGDIGQNVDFLVSGFDTINYLSEDELHGFFSWAAKHLNVDGQIIFDYSSPKLLREEWRNLNYDREISGGKLHWRHKYLDESERSETIIRQTSGGRELWSETHIQYSYDPFAINRIATSCGLEVKRVRNLDSSWFSPNANTHVYVVSR